MIELFDTDDQDVWILHRFMILENPPFFSECEGFRFVVRSYTEFTQILQIAWIAQENGGDGGLIEGISELSINEQFVRFHHDHIESNAWFIVENDEEDDDTETCFLFHTNHEHHDDDDHDDNSDDDSGHDDDGGHHDDHEDWTGALLFTLILGMLAFGAFLAHHFYHNQEHIPRKYRRRSRRARQ